MKKLLVSLFVIAFSFEAAAGAVVNSKKVNNVRADASGRAYVTFSAINEGTRAACGSGYNNTLGFTLTTPGGRGILAAVMTAMATGKTITARGTGTCLTYGVIENVDFLLINKN